MLNAIAQVALPVLCMLTPTLAFASVNTQFFSTRQIWNSLGASAILGLLAGLGLWVFKAPPLLTAGASLALFFLCSERLLTETMPHRNMRYAAMCAVAVLALGTAAWLGPLVVCLLFSVYGLFAIFDLHKNWRRPKEVIFSAKNKAEEWQNICPTGIKLTAKPNIYVFFLESIISRHALEVIYQQDDAGLNAFLHEENFVVYDNALSNTTYTAASLANILYMRHVSVAKQQPEALSILHENGYKLACFDFSAFVFHAYSASFDHISFSMPGHIEAIYDKVLPFFAQSRWLRHLTKNIDPFETTLDFSKTFPDVQQYMQHKNFKKHPQCLFIRFGAAHTPNEGNWRTFTGWEATYRRLYLKTVQDIEKMVRHLNSNDPEGIIVAVGDHGSLRYTRSWVGQGGVNASLHRQGLDPALVALDLTSVLLAIRWPSGWRPHTDRIAHVNLLRHVFLALGGEGALLEQMQPDISLLTHALPTPFCVARKGVPLTTWEPLSPGESLELRVHDFLSDQDNPEKLYDVISTLTNQGSFFGAIELACAVLPHHPHHENLLFLLVELYCKIGQAKKAAPHAKTLLSISKNREKALLYMAHALTLQGKYAEASALLQSKKGKRPKLDIEDLFAELEIMRNNNGIPSALSVAQQALKQHKWALTERYRLAKAIAVYLDHLERTPEALELLTSLPPLPEREDTLAHQINTLITLLSSRTCNWPFVEQQCHRLLTQRGQRTPSCVMVLLAGSLEMQGQASQALKVLGDAMHNRQGGDSFALHIGMFALRHKLNAPQLTPLKRTALKALRDKQERVAASGLFDAGWYAHRYATCLGKMEPLHHFAHFGALLALDPCPHFNSAYYYAMQPDVADSAMDPFLHYLTSNPYEERDPSVAFCTRAYITQHPEVLTAGITPLAHFLNGTKKQ